MIGREEIDAMLERIHHAGITVANLERSLRFYRDLLGLEVLVEMERDTPDIGQVVGYPGARIRIAFLGIPGDGARIELLEYVHPRGEPKSPETNEPPAGHVCFRVADIRALHARLVAAGVHIRSDGPVEITQGVNTGTLALYTRDPDGYTVELLQPPPGR
jgi:lactoylglutathione lyase